MIISAGVIGGIERMVGLLMPMLFILMMVMVINAMINGDFARGLNFLFAPDFSEVDATTFKSHGPSLFQFEPMGSIMLWVIYASRRKYI